LQCPYRYWHPYSNNASTDMEHVIIANTSTVIHMMPVLVSFIFAKNANTSTGISPMPILVLIFSQCLYWYWHSFSRGGGIRLLAILVHRILSRHCFCSAGMPVLVMSVKFCACSLHKRGYNAVMDCNRMGGRGR